MGASELNEQYVPCTSALIERSRTQKVHGLHLHEYLNSVAVSVARDTNSVYDSGTTNLCKN